MRKQSEYKEVTAPPRGEEAALAVARAAGDGDAREVPQPLDVLRLQRPPVERRGERAAVHLRRRARHDALDHVVL
jgi:hypothetical protein